MTAAAHSKPPGRFVLWVADGPLSRPGAPRRYTTMAVIIAVLVSLPALVGALPVSAKKVSTPVLLARIKASATTPFTGLASVSGALQIPDIGVSTEVTNLLSTTSRLRAWWAGPWHYRVDRLTAVAETDVYRNGRGVWTWNSDARLAQFTHRTPQIPLPGPEDALPSNLARRLLAQAPVSQLTRTGARKIAGHTALGLLWRPNDPRSLIAQVKVWADQDTGLPLAVEVRAVGGQSRAYSSSFLDLSLKTPDPARLHFDPSHDKTATVDSGEAGPDDNLSRFVLPASLGGLHQRSPMQPLVATYGTGVSLVAVSDLGDPQSALALRSQIDSPSRQPITGKFGTGSLIKTPLLTGLVFATNTSGYVLFGSVTRVQIEAMALDLVRHPPRAVGPAAGRQGSP